MILDTILEQFHSQFQMDSVSLFTLNHAERSLVYLRGRDYMVPSFTEPFIAQKVLREKKTLVLNCVGNKTYHKAFSNFINRFKIKRCISSPLVVNGEVIGVLEAYFKHEINPSPYLIEVFETLCGQVAIAIEHIKMLEELQNMNQSLTLAHESIIESWAKATGYKDHELSGHIERVADTTIRLGAELGLDGEALKHLRWGALLHDIGKMAIPDKILLKPGPLSGEERQIIEQHPVFAYEFLKGISFLKEAIDIPRYHHERWNGKGYPYRLRGEEIPLSARIFAIIDVWDALSCKRAYRDAWPTEQVLAYIENNAETHFDPELVPIFLAMLKKTN